MSTLAPTQNLLQLAEAAGLVLTVADSGVDFSGLPTARYTAALAADPSKNQPLELSGAFDALLAGHQAPDQQLTRGLESYFREAATRLKNPRPDVHLTLLGLPLSFGRFAWPFHGSTSGADTSIVHGEVRLEDGGESVLHAKFPPASPARSPRWFRRWSSPSRRVSSTTQFARRWIRDRSSW